MLIRPVSNIKIRQTACNSHVEGTAKPKRETTAGSSKIGGAANANGLGSLRFSNAVSISEFLNVKHSVVASASSLTNIPQILITYLSVHILTFVSYFKKGTNVVLL